MPVSWAAVVASAPPPPTPKQRWEALIATYAAKPLRLVLLEALGLLEIPLTGKNSLALPLVEHCVIVGVDTEAWTANTDEMTEIGLVVAEYKNGKDLNGDTGDFAENFLRRIKYYHLRIWENAHLKTNAEWMRGADGNRFGQSRFVTFTEARKILDEILDQPIKSTDPRLADLKRPVILIGHALAHDKDNLQKNGLHYDFRKHGTVVKEIDTQKLTKEVDAWIDKKSPNNDIGLDRLCEEVFEFAHADAHTALNDAARTVICAVNLALRNWVKGDKTEKTMQEVALDIERHSQDASTSTWGTKLCCTRCGGRDHSNNREQCKAPVNCKACEHFDEVTIEVKEADKQRHTGSHIEQYCLHVAEFNGWKRRVLDAHRKHNPLPTGPPPGSHPPSSWRGRWPMTCPSDALILTPPEKPEPVYIVRPSLRSLPDLPSTPAPLPGVKAIAFQSTGRARAEKARREKEQGEKLTTGSTNSGSRASSIDTWQSDDAWNGTAW